MKNNFPEVSLLGCKVTTGPLVMVNKCHCIRKLKNVYYSTITVLVSLDVKQVIQQLILVELVVFTEMWEHVIVTIVLVSFF